MRVAFRPTEGGPPVPVFVLAYLLIWLLAVRWGLLPVQGYRRLAEGDVACLLMEPALTNIGIVLPEEGYLAGVREITRKHGVLLVNDETHTICAGPGGAR